MLGLRVGEVCRIDITDLRQQVVYELLSVLGKGNKPAVIPLPIPVLRAVREAAGESSSGPLLLNRKGERGQGPIAACDAPSWCSPTRRWRSGGRRAPCLIRRHHLDGD
jgi:integrase